MQTSSYVASDYHQGTEKHHRKRVSGSHLATISDSSFTQYAGSSTKGPKTSLKGGFRQPYEAIDMDSGRKTAARCLQNMDPKPESSCSFDETFDAITSVLICPPKNRKRLRTITVFERLHQKIRRREECFVSFPTKHRLSFC